MVFDARRYSIPGLLCLAFVLGFFARAIISPLQIGSGMQIEKPIRETGKYAHIAPLLLCGTNGPDAQGPYLALKEKLAALIDGKKKTGDVTNVSVYFRGGSGNWIGINDGESYSPASLLKVPTMIAYFKAAESDPSILDKQLIYTGAEDLNAQETFKSEHPLVPGGSYKVIDLIRAMVINSDNNAAALLANNIDTKILDEVYTDLGLKPVEEAGPEAQTLNVKSYSYFFRVLYNATYLTPEYSEKAMAILDEADFPQGIQGGLPKGVSVAQKFGERTVLDQQGVAIERNLHDCGLIYAKNAPYLLCVMTRGKDFKNLSGTIQDISKTVYETMDTTNP